MSLYGVPTGVSYGQNERVDELNDRLQSRQPIESNPGFLYFLLYIKICVRNIILNRKNIHVTVD